MAERAVALHGSTHEQLGALFGVSRDTIATWTSRKPDFALALMRGREKFAAEHVENALLRRAEGYSEPYEIVTETVNAEGLVTGKVIKTGRHDYPPDATACMHWLSNRLPNRWKMNRSGILYDGNSPLPITVNLHLADLGQEMPLIEGKVLDGRQAEQKTEDAAVADKPPRCR